MKDLRCMGTFGQWIVEDDPLNESKINYVTLVLSACAIAVSAVSAGFSALGNSSNIDELRSKVNSLTAQNEQMSQRLDAQGDNRTRIDELDIGLTALASVTNVDLEKLAQAIAVARSQGQPAVQVDSSTAGTVESAPSADTDEPVTPPAQMADSGQAPAPKVHGAGASVAEPPVAKAGGEATAEDNPFANAAGADNGSNAPGNLAITSEPAAEVKPTSIKEVDAILGKRISENWYKPEGARPELSAIIQLKMARDGKVASVSLAKASGDAAFDASVMQAVHSIVEITEVRGLSDVDFNKAYASRKIQFTPQMGG